jgi:hypothetical protein
MDLSRDPKSICGNAFHRGFLSSFDTYCNIELVRFFRNDHEQFTKYFWPARPQPRTLEPYERTFLEIQKAFAATPFTADSYHHLTPIAILSWWDFSGMITDEANYRRLNRNRDRWRLCCCRRAGPSSCCCAAAADPDHRRIIYLSILQKCSFLTSIY